MSSSTKIVSFFLFFLLTTLQIHARDSQFFNKVSRVREDETSNPINQQNNELVPATSPVLKEQKKQLDEDPPNFLPQTTHTGYGLYGHETGIDTPSTTTTTTTTSPATADKSPFYNMDETKYESQNNGNSDMFSYNLDKKNYLPGLSETSYTNKVGPNKYVPQNNYNSNYNDNYENVEKSKNEKNYVPELTGLDENSYTNDNNNVGRRSNYVANTNYNNDDDIKEDTFNNDEKFNEKYVPQNNYNYNYNNKNVGVEKHGMSDTRYMENGKYYFDTNSKKDFYPTNTNTDTNDVYENKNSERDFYPTNTNTDTNERVFSNKNYENKNYYNGNGMQKGYKNNQVPKEDEFYFDDQP